jgi:hypothetical protein
VKLKLTEEQVQQYAYELIKRLDCSIETAIGLVIRNQKNIEEMIRKLDQIEDETEINPEDYWSKKT